MIIYDQDCPGGRGGPGADDCEDQHGVAANHCHRWRRPQGVFFFTSSGFFMREYDKTTNTMHCNVRVIKLLFSSPGEYGPTSSPGNWSVLTSLCQIEILHLEASGMYWVKLQLYLFSLSCNDLFLDLNFACSSSRGLYFFQTSFFFFLKSIIWNLSFL